MLVPSGDDEGFAAAITHLLSDSQERDRMGQQGRARVKSTFTWQSIAAQLDPLYTAQLNCLYQEFFQQNSVSRISKAA